MIEATSKRDRERSARAMTSENPTEFLSKRLLIGGVDWTDRVEGCVRRCERNDDPEDGGEGQPRPALICEVVLAGRIEGLGGEIVELDRLVDGVPHRVFTGEVLEADPKPEETSVLCASGGTWNAEISFGERTSFPGSPASTAAYSILRRNERYRRISIPRVPQPFVRRGSRDYQANAKLSIALDEIRRESGLVVLDRGDGTATGWVPPPMNSPGEPKVWYEVGVHIDEETFSAKPRREGSYRDAWAYRIAPDGEVLTLSRRPLERRRGTLTPPKGADFEIELSGAGEAEQNPGAPPLLVPLSTTAHQRTELAARRFSYHERDLELTVLFSDPRLERTDVIGVIHRTTEAGRAVLRRYAMPVEGFSDDAMTNEETYVGAAVVLSEEWAEEPRSTAPGSLVTNVSGGVERMPYGLDHNGHLYVPSSWSRYDPGRGLVLDATAARREEGVDVSFDPARGVVISSG